MNCGIYENEMIRVSVYANKNEPFSIGGRDFPNFRALYKALLIVRESELYPCFDSYDAVNESRYYRWFFVCPTLSTYISVKRLLRTHTIPLRQILDPSQLNSLANLYKDLPVPMVFCEDSRNCLFVVERL